MDAPEPPKFLERCARHAGEIEIQLDRFIVADLTAVRDRDYSADRTAGGNRFHSDRQSAICKGGVTQPVAEGIERSSFKVPVSAALHRVVLKRRQLTYILVEGHRQPAGGIVTPRESFGDRCADLLAGVPGFEDRAGVLLGPVHTECAAVGEDKDDRLAGGNK